MFFQQKFWKYCAGAMVIGSLMAVPAFASSSTMAQQHQPAQPVHDRFNKMDTNGDGKVVLEEFRVAFPKMNEKAFAVIDLNGDNAIDRAEWFEFTEGHASGDIPGMRKGAPMNNIPGDPIIPPPDSSDLPLMRPPN